MCDAALTADDLETNFIFSTAIDGSTATNTTTLSLSKSMTRRVSYTPDGGVTSYADVADTDLTTDMILGWRVQQGIPSIKANGSINLKLEQISGALPLQIVFEDADINVKEDGRLAVSGKWSLKNSPEAPDISLNNLTITIDKTASDDREFKVILTLPDIDYTVEFSVPVEEISGANELLGILI